MNAHLQAPPLTRIAPVTVAAVLLAAIVLVYADASPGWWPLLVFGLGPDIAGLLSIEPGLERGRMSPRAVPLYNLLHRPLLPLTLGAVVLLVGLPVSLLVGALAWGLHIAVDRALGYGLRTRDGYQR